MEANQRRKLWAAAEQAYLNSLRHEQLTEPLLSNFGLTEQAKIEVELYNIRVEKKRTSGSLWMLLVCIVVSTFVVAWYYPDDIISWVLSMPGIFFFFYLPLPWLFTKLFPFHPKTSKLDEYKASVQQYKDWLEVRKRDFWTKLTGRQFEIELGKLLRSFFDHVEVTKGSGDGGVDLIIQDGKTKIIVQCKNHRKQIGPEPVRALVGVTKLFQADKAVVVSLGGFTKGAKEFAVSSSSLFLYDLKDVLSLTEQVGSGRIEFAGKSYAAHV